MLMEVYETAVMHGLVGGGRLIVGTGEADIAMYGLDRGHVRRS